MIYCLIGERIAVSRFILARKRPWIPLHVCGENRVKVAQRNLDLCFPEISQTRRDYVVKENFKNTGFAIFESAIAWFWPDWRLKTSRLLPC